jgi:hypothetical protein
METPSARLAVVFFKNTENLGEWLKFLPEWACTTTTDKFVVVVVAFDERIEARSFLAGFLATSWPYQQIGPIFVGRSSEEIQALMEQWLREHQ